MKSMAKKRGATEALMKEETCDYSKSVLEQGYDDDQSKYIASISYSPLRKWLEQGNDIDDFEFPPPPIYSPVGYDEEDDDANDVRDPQSTFPFVENPEEYHRNMFDKQNLTCAQRSLEFYNKEKGTNYELVEALLSNAMFKNGRLALHCNFKAKPSNQNTHSSIKLFFGELHFARPSTLKVCTYCDIIRGKSHGCEFCGKDSGDATIKHPHPRLISRSSVDAPYALRTRSRTRSSGEP